MSIPPHIFCKIKGKTFFPNSSLCCKFSLKISPESFKSIYMINLLVRILTLAMFYQAKHIAFSSYPRITSPGIRAYCGTWLYTLLYKRNKGLCLDIRDYLCPHLPLATQNTQATPFLPANYIGFRVIASKTFMSICHTTNVSAIYKLSIDIMMN